MAISPMIDALHDAVRSASLHTSEALDAERIIRGRVYLVLNHAGMRDRHIRKVMGWTRHQLRDARAANLNSGAETVQVVWAAADITTPWRRTPQLTLSGQVCAANSIAARHFDSTDSLDTSGAEYVNVRTGEKWLIVSHQRWNGVPAQCVSGASGTLVRYQDRPGGEYELWYVGPSGVPVRHRMKDTIGLCDSLANFSANGQRGDGQAFDAVDTALKLSLGVLPDGELWLRRPVRHRWWHATRGTQR